MIKSKLHIIKTKLVSHVKCFAASKPRASPAELLTRLPLMVWGQRPDGDDDSDVDAEVLINK